MKLTECMSIEEKYNQVKKNWKQTNILGQYQTKVATVHLARNM